MTGEQVLDVRPRRQRQQESPVDRQDDPPDEPPYDRRSKRARDPFLFAPQAGVCRGQQSSSGQVSTQGDPPQDARGERTDRAQQVQGDRQDPNEIRREQDGGSQPQSRGRVAQRPKRMSPVRQAFVPFPGLRTRRRLVKGFGPKVPGDDLRDPGRANLFVLPAGACLIAAARNAEGPEDDASPDVWLRSLRVSAEAAQPRSPAGGGPPRTSPSSSGTNSGPASLGSPARGRRGSRGPRPRPIGGRGGRYNLDLPPRRRFVPGSRRG